MVELFMLILRIAMQHLSAHRSIGSLAMTQTDKINLAEKFALFSEHWRPKTITALNGQEIKLIKVQGEFPWHVHEQEDEFFLVWKGQFRVEFRDRIVELWP